MDKYLTDNEIIEIIKEYVDNSVYNSMLDTIREG